MFYTRSGGRVLARPLRVGLTWSGRGLLSGAFALIGCAVLATTVAAQTTQYDPAQVVEAYERARGAGDIDAAMAEFADSAVITIQGGNTISYVGSARLRMFMQTIGTRFHI